MVTDLGVYAMEQAANILLWPNSQQTRGSDSVTRGFRERQVVVGVESNRQMAGNNDPTKHTIESIGGFQGGVNEWRQHYTVLEFNVFGPKL